MIHRRADRAAAVTPSREVRGEPPDGGLTVVAGELSGALNGHVAGPGELVSGVDEFERVFDRGRRQQAPGELGGDARPAETLAFLEGADEVLGQREIVDEAGPLEALDFGRDDVVVEFFRAERTLHLALRHAASGQRVERDVVRAFTLTIGECLRRFILRKR